MNIAEQLSEFKDINKQELFKTIVNIVNNIVDESSKYDNSRHPLEQLRDTLITQGNPKGITYNVRNIKNKIELENNLLRMGL